KTRVPLPDFAISMRMSSHSAPQTTYSPQIWRKNHSSSMPTRRSWHLRNTAKVPSSFRMNSQINSRNPIALHTRLEEELYQSSSVVFSAFFANTIDLEGMASGLVMMFAADFLLQAVHFRGEKLDGSAAIGAHHVVMTAAIVLVFVAGNPIVEGDFAGQSAFG